MVGRLSGLTLNRDGTQNITVTVNADFTEEYDELRNCDIIVEIKKFFKKRSLDANAYAWTLIGKIAEKQNISKNEVYRKEVVEHGTYVVHCLEDKDVEQSCEDWCSFGLGFQVDIFPSKLPGCTNVMFYKGSSYYNSKEMAKLIDGIIHEAEGLGIPTITEKEKEKMLGKWEKKHEKRNNS